MGDVLNWTAIIAALGSVGAAFLSWGQALSVKREEASLRVKAEVRLQLFSRMAESAEQAARVLAQFDDLDDYSDGRVKMGTLLRWQSEVALCGFFLPPDLEEPFKGSVDALVHLTRVERGQESRPGSFPDVEAALEARSKATAFRTAYVAWKNREYNALTGALP